MNNKITDEIQNFYNNEINCSPITISQSRLIDLSTTLVSRLLEQGLIEETLGDGLSVHDKLNFEIELRKNFIQYHQDNNIPNLPYETINYIVEYLNKCEDQITRDIKTDFVYKNIEPILRASFVELHIGVDSILKSIDEDVNYILTGKINE